MNKVWKIVLTIALVALVLGLVCIGVSFITGANLGRISSAFYELYDVDAYRAAIDRFFDALLATGV